MKLLLIMSKENAGKKNKDLSIKKNIKRNTIAYNPSIDKKTLLSFAEINKNKKKKRKRRYLKDIYGLVSYVIDEEVDKKELNKIPYTQALRIDKRNYFDMFLSFLANEIDLIKIFYYKNPFEHISLSLSLYAFESCLDFTLNCFLCNDDVVSQKFHNNGSIRFITSFSLSLMSNIFSSVLVFLVGKLADYAEILEHILKEIFKESKYFITIEKFKKCLIIKLTLFFILQIIINLSMCYYLMIFCTIYHKIQGNIMLNYLLGFSQSLLLSLGIAIFSSLLRFLSLKYKWKYIYYTSKHLFEKSNIEILF